MANRIRHFTVLDAIYHLFRWGGTNKSTEDHWEEARLAVRTALEVLAAEHPWSYYMRRGTIALTAADSGDASFDLTGGTSERLVTRSTSTFPSWAARGTIELSDGIAYSVDGFPSTSTLTLEEGSHPAADLSSGAYTMYRDSYELPDNVARCDRMFREEDGQALDYLDPADYLTKRYDLPKTSEFPKFWTIMGDADQPGRMIVRFLPYPSAAKTIEFIYQARPREPLIDRYDYKTVSTSSTTVTGSTTTFYSGMKGSVIRFGYSKLEDEDNELDSLGQWFERVALPRPYIYEARITGYTNATSLTIDEALPSNVAGVKYVISDPIDIEPIMMRDVFLRLAERQYAVIRRDMYQEKAEMLYQQALAKAIEYDQSRRTAHGAMGPVNSRNSRDGIASAGGEN